MPPAAKGSIPIDEGIIIFPSATVGSKDISMVSLPRDPRQLSFGFYLSGFTPLDFSVKSRFK